MTFVPFSRVLMLVMSGVICFVLLVPLALQRHNVVLAVAVVAIFAAYAIANVLLWLRLKSRA